MYLKKEPSLLGLASIFVLLWFIIVWGHSWEAELKFDALTYATLARNILLTHDWKTLHWADSGYKDFYQHPPLIIWLQAIFFKIFGISTVSARVLPSIFMLGTFAEIWFFCVWRKKSHWFGFLACLVLLSTTRYTKFASDFYLDNPLSFFMFGGFLFFLSWQERVWSPLKSLIGLGACIALGFMAKGLTSLALTLGLLFYAGWMAIAGNMQLSVRALWGCSIGIFIACFFMSPWFLFANGAFYLKHYFMESISGRTSAVCFRDQIVPVLHLLKTYWPWWPFLILSAYRLIRSGKDAGDRVFLLALGIGLIVVGAFSYVGHSLEHYYLPFYVFAAPVIALPLFESEKIYSFHCKVINFIKILAISLAFLLAILPIPIHASRDRDLRKILEVAVHRCPKDSVRQVLISQKHLGHWYSLALGMWATPWQVVIVSEIPEFPGEKQLLITGVAERVNETNWNRIAYEVDPSLILFQSSHDCRPLN